MAGEQSFKAVINDTNPTFNGRAFSMEIKGSNYNHLLGKKIGDTAKGIAKANGGDIDFTYKTGYPPTINHEEKTNFAIEVAKEVCGSDKVLTSVGKEMGAEDFSYMLQKRPGAYLFMGIGDGAGLHNPNYDFNDAAAPVGASFFARLIEKALPLV